MMSLLKRLVAPPVFEPDEDKTLVAASLSVLLLAAILVLLAAVPIFALAAPASLPRVLATDLPVVVVLMVIWVLARRGRVRLAAVLAVAVSWAAVTLRMVLAGGLEASLFGLEAMLVVLLGGLLLGPRGAFVIVLVNVLTGVAIAWAHRQGWIPPVPSVSHTSILISYGLNLLAAAAGLYVILNALHGMLARGRLELAQRQHTERALRQREAILGVVARAAGLFLSTKDWRSQMPALLQQLGEVTSSSHVYLFENHRAPDGTLRSSQRYEWAAPGIPPDMDSPVFQDMHLDLPGLEAWYQALSQGQPFAGTARTFPESWRNFLIERGILSLLEVPVQVGGQWWGILGLDDSRAEREWSAVEVDAMRTAAGLVAAAIQRQRDERAVQQREAILEAVAIMSRMFLEARDWQPAIESALALLGKASGASHVYIFENRLGPDGVLHTSQRQEWARPGERPHIDEVIFQNSPITGDGLDLGTDLLSQGEPFYGSASEYPEYWARNLDQFGIKSILEVPIFVGGEWWGTLGFDDCQTERPWSAVEVEFLSTAAGLFSTALQRQRADQALRQREAILEAVARAARSLLEAPDWRQALPDILALLGRASGASHVYLFENHAGPDGRLRTSQRFEWTALGAASHLQEPAFQNTLVYDEGANLWADLLSRGQTFYGTPYDHSEYWAENLAAYGIKTALEAPIHVGGRWWGLIGFDDCDTERAWSPAEVDILTVVAGMISTAIQRQQAEAERERLIRELAAKNTELERFTYTVSHDLKSPLITIRGFLGYLGQDAQAGNLDRLQQDMARITDATSKMQRLLDELLELSRIGRVVNPPEQVPFEAVARDALSLVDGRLRARGVQVEISPGLPVVCVDRYRLVQAVQNLLDNAVKFMGDQAEPRIVIGQRPPGEDAQPLIFVRDNGVGLDLRYHDRVFGLFEKLDSKVEGTGVGLALVKRIIDVHNGRIWVESDGVGRGTTFCFTLPVK